jgi:hypothetical protein
MDQSGREDPKLREVKAVLHRLQGLPAEPESADFRAGSGPPLRGFRIGIAGIVVAAVGAAVATLAAFPNLRQLATSVSRGSPETAVPRASDPKAAQVGGADSTSVAKTGPVPDAAKAPAIKAALEGAKTLMDGGRVKAARQRLRAVASDDAPDVLWALARSYDPNVLAQISASDAPPDVPEAERWYRAWYAAAVKQGLVRDSVSLERIIGSMQRP